MAKNVLEETRLTSSDNWASHEALNCMLLYALCPLPRILFSHQGSWLTPSPPSSLCFIYDLFNHSSLATLSKFQLSSNDAAFLLYFSTTHLKLVTHSVDFLLISFIVYILPNRPSLPHMLAHSANPPHRPLAQMCTKRPVSPWSHISALHPRLTTANGLEKTEWNTTSP